MSQIQRVLLVGHCGFDAPQIANMVRTAVPDVAVAEAHTAGEVETAGPDTLLLVNRQLGHGFNADTGVELIERLSRRADPPVSMLVSNYADSQAAAVAAGARPGFGKSAMHGEKTRQLLREVILGTTADR